MTIEHWLAIAVIITAIITAVAMLLAPSLAELVKYRISQPKPNPEANQPKNLSQRIGGSFKDRLKVFWRQYLFIIWNLAFLVWFVIDPAPPTRLTVLVIAVAVGGILLSFLSMSIIRTQMLIIRVVESLVELSSFVNEVSRRTVTLAEALVEEAQRTGETIKGVDKLVDIIGEMKDDARKKPLDPLLDAVKKLLGG